MIGWGTTTDKRACYGLSTIFSASAVTSGSIAVMAGACQISQTAALQLEGKPIPPRLRRYAKPGNGLSFISPRSSPRFSRRINIRID